MNSVGKTQDAFSSFIEEKYIPLETKAKLAVITGLLLLPIALCYFLIYKPDIATMTSLDGEIATVRKEVDKAKIQAGNLPRIKKELAETRTHFEKAASILPKESEIPELLRNISDRGKNAGLDFLSFAPGNEILKDFYAEIPINISTRGPYHNMGYFLDQVSKLERLVTVNNIKMSSPKKEGLEMLLHSSCRLVTYRFTNIRPPSENQKKK